MPSLICQRIVFRGRVQGVGFRHSVYEIAQGFDVCGTIENLLDGTVELIAQAAPDELAAFLDTICHHSPLAHHIVSHHSYDLELQPELKGFSIVR